MKKIITITLTAFCTLLLFGIVFSGCTKDKCEDTYCLNGGDCVDGKCKCPVGYYGTHCEKSSNGGGSGSGSGGGSGSGSGGGNGKGNVVFWINDDYGCGPISVTVNGMTRSITQYSNTGAADCGESGFANFSLAAGNYHYSASCSGLNWSGTISIEAGTCLAYHLMNNGSGSGSGGGNGGGGNGGGSGGGGNGGGGNGGGGGNSQSGQLTFWTDADYQCGPISVTCNGITRTITKYYDNTPSCGASFCANYTLPPGSYHFTAHCTDQNWSGTVRVQMGGCTTMRLH